MRLDIENLSVRRGPRLTVDHASLSAGPGEFIGLIGPNGAGKTSLMRAALGLIPATGQSSLATLPPARAILHLLSRFPAAGYIPSLFSSHEYGIVMLNIRALSQHNA